MVRMVAGPMMMMLLLVGITEIVIFDMLPKTRSEGHVPQGEEDGGVKGHHVHRESVHDHHLEG